MGASRCLLPILVIVLLSSWTVLAAGGASEETSSETDDHQEDYSTSHSDGTSHDTSHDTSHTSSANVFVLGSLFDYDIFIILLSTVGGCALFMELALAKYEEWLRLEGDTFQSTLKDKIVRELMTLGVISFALFLLEPVVTHGDYYLIFEFCHYVIFFIAIFTVAQLILLGHATYPIKRAWDVAAFHSKEEVLMGYRTRVAKARRWSVPVPMLGRVSLDVFHLGDFWKYMNRVQFHIARSVFIRQIGQTADFDFARYACLVTDRQILSMANPPLWAWMLLIVLHWVGYGLRKLFDLEHKMSHYGPWLVFGLVLLFLEGCLLFACIMGMKCICVKLGADQHAYRSTLDAVLQRVWVAPITHLQQSRIRRANSMSSAGPKGAAKVAPSTDDSASGVAEEKSNRWDTSVPDAPVASIPASALQSEGTGGEGGEAAANVDVIPEITRKDAFLFNSCRFHRFMIQGLMMLNSYYLSFFAVYHIGQATHNFNTYEWIWVIILPMPILIGTLTAYRRVLPLFSLLSAVVLVQASDVALVGQEAEETNKVRRKLVLRVQDVLQKEFQLSQHGEVEYDRQTALMLINRWDMDGDRKLSYWELEKGLKEFGLVMSRRQRRELLRLADPDRNGKVDIDELADFLYDVEVAMAAAKHENELDVHGKVDSDEDENMDVRLDRLLTRRGSSRLVLTTASNHTKNA